MMGCVLEYILVTKSEERMADINVFCNQLLTVNCRYLYDVETVPLMLDIGHHVFVD